MIDYHINFVFINFWHKFKTYYPQKFKQTTHENNYKTFRSFHVTN